MIDVYLLVAAIAFVVVILITNTYFLAHFAHPNDTKFGSHPLNKILVVSMNDLQVIGLCILSQSHVNRASWH